MALTRLLKKCITVWVTNTKKPDLKPRLPLNHIGRPCRTAFQYLRRINFLASTTDVNEVTLQLYGVINSLTGRRFTILQIEKNNATHIKRASIQNRTAVLNMYLAYNSVTFLIDRCLSC